MRTIVPIDRALVGEPQKRFVNQRGRLQRVARAFGAQLTGRDPSQLAVHEREQTIERAPITVAPFVEQPCDVVTRGHDRFESVEGSTG